MNTPQYRKPRVIGLTSGAHKLLMIYLSHILLAGRASSSGTSQIMFSLLMDPYHTFVPLGVEVASTSPLSCARTCLYRYNTCFSFSINDTLKTCTLGLWLKQKAVATSRPTTYSVTTSRVTTYSVTPLCDTSSNFSFHASGSVGVCVRLSRDLQNYLNAKESCKDMGGNLYTVKSQEKLSIMRGIVAAETVEFWVGLDDLSSVGVFRWADDGTGVADSWGPVIFATGEPSSPGVEDCVEYQPRIQGLNDAFCSLQSRYLCEMKYRLL